MSHRIKEKQARREARLRTEAKVERAKRQQRLMRRAGYGAVGAIGATLIAFAVLGGASGTPSGNVGGSVGAEAPDFALTDVVNGQQVSASSLRGRKTMLFFSEGVNCQACMVQAADLEKGDTLKKAGIRLVSVTTDQSDDLARAAEQYGIDTPLLADPTTEMSSAYGMLGHGGMGHPTQDGHAFILLNANGKVLWHRAYQEMYVKPRQLMDDMRAELKT